MTTIPIYFRVTETFAYDLSYESEEALPAILRQTLGRLREARRPGDWDVLTDREKLAVYDWFVNEGRNDAARTENWVDGDVEINRFAEFESKAVL